MLKSRLYLWVAIALISLSACKENETSVTLSGSDAAIGSNTAVASSENNVATTQTLSSRDEKLSIVVDGNFVDEMDDAENRVLKDDLATLILLQYDEKSNITLIANDLGPLKIEAKDYFANLVDSLKKSTSLKSLDVGIATDNRINYRISHEANGVILNESCVAIVANNNLYSVCATSDTAKPDALAATLKTININN